MAKTVIGLEVNMNSSGAEGSVKSLKAQLREAQAEVAAMSDKFGLTSEQAQKAAQKAAQLKDAIGDAKTLTDAFNPDAKFKSFSNAISGVVGGFSALQGAQALFGEQSEELTKTLAKVQGAMALSQGINSILEAQDAFKILGTVIKTNVVAAFSTLKGAIISTGIGALVVAVGLLVNELMNMSDAADEAAEATKKLNEETKRYADEGLKGELDYLDRTQKLYIAQAKNKGASEKEIFDLEQQYRQLKINSLTRYYNEVAGKDDKAAKETLKQINDLQNDIKVAELDFDTKQDNEKKERNKKRRDENAAESKKELEERIARENAQLNAQNDLGKQKQDAQIQNATNFNNTLKLLGENVTDNEINESKKRIANAEAEAIMKKQIVSSYVDALGSLAQLVGTQTAVGKGLALAQIAIGTATGYIQGLDIAQKSAKAAGPGAALAFPLFYAQQIAAVLGAAAKAKSILTSVKGATTGGSFSAPSVPAPIGTQMGATALQQAQINAAGNAAVQAFVLESDVSGNQERIERLNRAARIQ